MSKEFPRKPISKKVRFEVFKRDSFTCQYCGKKAPEVLLEIEHIKPVSKGGTNHILNLTTACTECNAGKSDRELSDNSVIEKQRKQLEQLQERREQLEMMMQWHEGIQDHAAYEVDKFLDYFNKVTNSNTGLSEHGKATIKKHINKYGFQKLLEAVDVLGQKYISLEIEEKFNKIGAILHYMTSSDSEKQVMYIKGICRNRFNYFDPGTVTELAREVLRYYTYESILEITKNSRNWSGWRSTMRELIEDAKKDNDTDEQLPF